MNLLILMNIFGAFFTVIPASKMWREGSIQMVKYLNNGAHGANKCSLHIDLTISFCTKKTIFASGLIPKDKTPYAIAL